MQKLKQFLANNKAVRIVCIVLAIASVVGLFSALASGLRRDKIDEGVEYPSGHINVTGYGTRSSDYSVLYEQDGLVACYVAYSMDSIKPTTSERLLWENQVAGGKDAYLYGSTFWRPLNGGIGYTMNRSQWDLNHLVVSCTIPYDLRESYEDYTVECVLSYNGVTDETGEVYNAQVEAYPYGMMDWEKSAFRIGYYHSLSYVAKSATATNQSFSNRWFASNTSPYECYKNGVQGQTYYVVGQDYFPKNHRQKISLLTFKQKKDYDSWSLVFSSAYGRWGDETLSVSSHILPGVGIDSLEYNDGAAPFSLLNGFPGTLYAIRYYDCEISPETKFRNFFVDLCGFYKINVADFFKLSSDELEEFLINCGREADSMAIEMDAGNVAANRAKVYEIINQKLKG